MNKKRIRNSILFVGIILLGYLNYYKEEDGFGVIPNVIETTNVVYDTSGYHIEAEKQIDDMDLDTTKFEKATAKYDEMILSGNKVFLDAGKNLFLEENIVGDNGAGWKMYSEAMSYNQYKDQLTSNKGMKAVNEAENLTLEGKEIVTNKKFDVIDISKDVTLSNDRIKISGDKGNYKDKTKQFVLTGNGKFESLGAEKFSGEFNQGKYYTDKDKIELRYGYTGYYDGAIIKGKSLDYNNANQTFIAKNNPVIQIDGYTINSSEIKKLRPENEIDIVGKVSGTNGDIRFSGDYGVYKMDEKILYLDGNVVITNSKGEKITGDLVRYNFETKIADLSNKGKDVVYTYETRKVTTKKMVYDFNKENMLLNDGYVFEDNEYRSIGKNMKYNNISKIGNIQEGKVFVKATGENLEAREITFDTTKKDYTAIGDVRIDSKNSIVTTDKVEYFTSQDKGIIPNSFEMKNKKDGSIINGKNAIYTISKNQVTSEEEFNYTNKDSYLSGKGILYDLTTEEGKILSAVNYKDSKSGNNITGDRAVFKKENYLNIKENVKLTTKSEEMTTTEANYSFVKDVVDIPNAIEFKSLDGGFKGNLVNGKLYNSKKLFIGNKLSGVSNKGENIVADKLEYSLNEKKAKLKNNVVVTNTDSKLSGNEVTYDTKKNEVFAVGNVKMNYQSNVDLKGENLLVNNITKDVSGEKINIITTKKEKLSSDKFKGNLNTMAFRLLENVKGEFISKDEKQNKDILTKLSGNDITVFMAKDKNGGTKVQRVQGKKNTLITREGQNIKSDNIDYNSLTGKVVASKNNKIYVENTQDKTTVLSEKIEGNLNEEKLYFKAKTTIESYNEKNEKTTLVGNSGVVDNKQETVDLKENVKMENNQFIFSADRIIYNKKTQKVKAFGNTKIDYKIK